MRWPAPAVAAAQYFGTGDGEAAEGHGICRKPKPAAGGVPRFLLRTKFGLEEITPLEYLQLRLAMVVPDHRQKMMPRAGPYCGSSETPT